MKKTKMICKLELSTLKLKLKEDWGRYLKKHGVKFPNEGQRLNGILCLYENLGKPLSQDEMIKWFQERKLRGYDRQIRHIADEGWYIIGGNKRATRYEVSKDLSHDQICLKTIKKPNPLWSAGSLKRKNFFEAGDWEEILEIFKDRGCAVCGIHFENYDKGHLLTGQNDSYNKKNIVPMCTSCNNWGQRHNFEFKVDAWLRARPIIKKRNV